MANISEVKLGNTTYDLRDNEFATHGYRNYYILPDGSDLNDISGNRVVFVTAGASHLPAHYPDDFGTNGACIIVNNMLGNGTYRNQIAIRQLDGYVMYRRLSGTQGWSEWTDISSTRAVKVPDKGIDFEREEVEQIRIADLEPPSFVRVCNAPDAPEWLEGSTAGLWVLTMEEKINQSSSITSRTQLAFAPSKGNIASRYRNSSDNEYSEWQSVTATGEKEIKILCIGNSATADTLSYMPFILEEIAPEIKLTLVMAFYPSATIDMHISAFDNDTTVYYKCIHTPSETAWTHPWGRGADSTLKEILRSENWDFITFQQSTLNQPNWSTYGNLNTLIDKVVGYVNNRHKHPVKLGWLMVQVRPEDVARFPAAAKNAQRVLQTTPIDFVIPLGTALQNARNTSLQSLGDSGNLQCSDGAHLQEGIPCIIGGYTGAIKILEMCGLGYKSVFGSSIVPTDQWLSDKNMPHANGSSVGATTSNCYLAQKCAIEAIKNPYRLMTESNDEVYKDTQVQLDNLNNALDFSTGHKIIPMYDGKYINLSGTTVPMQNGKPTFTDASYMGQFDVGIIKCEPDEFFTINGHGGSDTRLWAFVNSSGTILSVSAASATSVPGGTVLKAPRNAAWLIIHDNSRQVSYKGLQTDIDAIRDAVKDSLPYNVLPLFGSFVTRTLSGVTYTWDQNKKSCIIDGTASQYSFYFIWAYTDGLPGEVKAGHSYQLMYEPPTGSASAVKVQIYFLHADESVDHTDYNGNAIVDIPEDCVGISIRLYVPSGTVCQNAVANIEFRSIGASDVTGGSANHEAKMLSVGSSFITGLVYPNGVNGTKANFDDSPYGNVAIGLGILERNVQNILMPSTGLLYAANQDTGNILNKLKSMDLSKYDYILTEYNRPDLGTGSNAGFPLGNLNSIAGDGSIVGAVLDLLAYVKSSNPTATVIIVGAPPSATDNAHAYQNVFTATYNNGVSIGQADLMMHRLALREHFIFIDWEDLNLSYYYKDLCYPGNVHPQDSAPLRAMGLYLARQCNYTTSRLKVLEADMH